MTLIEKPDVTQSQLDKFKLAAREHEADEDEARWDARLAKVAKAKPQAPEGPVPRKSFVVKLAEETRF